MKERTLLDIIDMDLAGYRLKAVYWIRMNHQLMRGDPIMRADTQKAAIFYDRELAEWAKTHVKARCEIVIETGIAIMDMSSGESFLLSYGKDGNICGRRPASVMSVDDLSRLISSRNSRPFF